jgi:hypothetical protein
MHRARHRAEPELPQEPERFVRVCRVHGQALTTTRDGALHERLSCPSGHAVRAWAVVDADKGVVVAIAALDRVEAEAVA